MISKLRFLSFLALLLTGCATSVQPASIENAGQAHQVRLLAKQSPGEGITVRLTFTNNSGKDLLLDKTNGCLGGSIRNDVFHITDANGNPIPYKLPLRKRLSQGADEVVRLAPKSTLTATVRLDAAYNFPPGEQTFKIIYTAIHSQPDGSPAVLAAETAATFNIFARKEIGSAVNTRRDLTAAEQRQVQQSLETTRVLLASGKAELDNWSSTSRAARRRFAIWFGLDDEPTRATVQTAIQRAIDLTASLQLDSFAARTTVPEGDENVAAELDELNRKIVLYPAFFRQPETGAESKAGIIAHEIFHFKEVAAALDHVYGITRCKELAKSLPNRAVENADNLEFYIEGLD